MRSVINISLPASLAAEVKKEVKKRHFSSTSEFFRHLWRQYQTQIVLRELKKSEEDFKAGRYKVLKSLRELK